MNSTVRTARASTSARERRGFPDRRKRSTPFPIVGLLMTPARRRRMRRDEEARNRYVDLPSSGVIWWVIVLMCMSTIDAAFTLIHIHMGGEEIVPTMQLALRFGPEVFVAVKLGLTALGAVLLAAHEHFRLARWCIHALLALYTVLVVYHLVLILQHW